jgi:sugar-phosphatase
MRKFLCSAILFDLDGVLIDSTKSVSRVWRAWAVERGLDPEYVIHNIHGRPTSASIQFVAPHLDIAVETPLIEQREIDDTEGVDAIPGSKELLAQIPHGAWCIVTSGTRKLATSRIKVGGLPTPDVFVTFDDITHGKPHPEPYLLGASKLGVDPGECLVFEDAPAGIEAGKAAGMKVIGVPSTYGPERLTQADAICKGLEYVSVRVSPRLDGAGSLMEVTVNEEASLPQ